MPQDYIDLSRRFIELKAGKKLEAGWSGAFNGMSHYGLSWDDLLRHSRVVILAETGMGKTAELKARARALRDGGEEAFYLRLDSLLDNQMLEATDGAESRMRLDAWLRGGGHATFLLDSVDEAKLRSRDGFSQALNRLSTGLGKAQSRARIVITSRPSPDWDDEADRANINNILPAPKELRPFQVAGPKDNQNSVATESVKVGGEERQAVPLVVGLLQLGSAQNETLARALGVSDLEAFLRAVDDANASEFLGRPADVIDLLEVWREKAALGSLRDILEATIRRRLRQDPRRGEISLLDPKSARDATETLAAALILCRRGTMAGWDCPPETATGSIDPRECLADWAPLEIHALLVRPLFEMESFGQLRFARRSFREYLFAMWIIRLLNRGASIQTVLPILIGKAYGVTTVLPYVAESAAWLGQLDDRIGEAILAVEPMLLLQAGDPSLLPIDVRIRLLKLYVAHFESRPEGHLSVDIKMVQRMVTPELGTIIARYLKAYPKNKPIQHLMLRLAWQGNLKEIWPIAMKIAIDHQQGQYERNLAVRIIAGSQNRTYLQKLAVALFKNGAHFNGAVMGEALLALYPAYLSPADLTKILENVEPPSRFTVGINHTLEQIAQTLPSGNPSEEFVKVVLQLLRLKPYVEYPKVPISERYKWLLGCLGELLKRELARPGNHSETILCAAELFSVGSEYDSDARRKAGELRKVVRSDRALSLKFFWRAVRRAKMKIATEGNTLNNIWQVRTLGELWSLEPADFDSLVAAISTAVDAAERLIALSAAIDVLLDRTPGSPRIVQLQIAAAGFPELKAQLLQLLANGLKTQQKIEYEQLEEKYKRERDTQETKRNEHETALVERIKANAAIMAEPCRSATPEGFHDLLAVTHWLLNRGSSISRYADLDVAKGRRVFGDVAIDAYLVGIKAYWRTYRTRLNSEGASINETRWGSIVALPGVTAEAAADPLWPVGLTAQDAELALRHALCELNGFPVWFDRLVAAFPNEARTLIRGEVAWEWDDTSDNCPYYVLADLVQATPAIREIFSEDVLALLQSRMPQHHETLRRALQIVCSSPIRVRPTFKNLCKRRLALSTRVEEKTRWLSAWMIVDTQTALAWTWTEIGRLSPQDGDLLVAHLLSDLFDTHGQNLELIQAVHTNSADQLAQLVRLSFRHVRPQDDVRHDDVYSPDVRDRAEDARRYFMERLANVPGPEAHAALLALAQDKTTFNGRMREYFSERALVRASLDAEPQGWPPLQVCGFEQKFEREPATLVDLMTMILGRISDISYDLDHGDFSERDNLRVMTQETQAQRWLASRLREASRGMYNVTREEEVIARKETDVRIHHPKAGALTIEIKLADKWGYEDLRTGFTTQLIGQYLRDRKGQAGIYLLIHRGANRKSWTISKKKAQPLSSVVENIKRKRIPYGRIVEIRTIDVSPRPNR